MWAFSGLGECCNSVSVTTRCFRGVLESLIAVGRESRTWKEDDIEFKEKKEFLWSQTRDERPNVIC